ncbi:MAG TPA: tRNA (N6-isopentenyl adenosine(37)-C2)-methylthiotransferase MiaB [Candidatus Coatesbacteria bacterium]|nr:tRNA (N6-isopentenyl adenosine(37)-C2)-methylthiotransferase MiaB [Candidatus Coatesbacteria bacterium]
MTINLYLESQGCQMNERDAERLAAGLLARGWRLAKNPAEADLILVNACSVREKAVSHALGRLRQLYALTRKKPGLLFGLTGCLAQHLGEEARDLLPRLNLLTGPGAVARLARLLESVKTPDDFAQDLEPADPEPDFNPAADCRLDHPALGPQAAFVTVMEGCDNRCAYCVVPLLRGPEVSRSPESVLAEVAHLAAQGFSEVVLLGQNVNSYRSGDYRFPRLLREVARIDGMKRVRFTTSHPKDLSPELLEVMAAEPAVCEQLHLPLQSGSDRILSAMGRGYTAEHYRNLVEKARRLLPGLTLTTDLIVGFPGETEEDFDETAGLVAEIGFDSAFMFKYSPRPGTPAYSLPDDMPPEVKQARLERVIGLVTESAFARNRALVGETVEVVVEGRDKRGKPFGRTRGGKPVKLPGSALGPGRHCTAEITGAGPWSLVGRPAEG